MINNKHLVDALAAILSIISSISLIMVNKILMGAKGCAFQFATCLNGLHFFTTALGLFAARKLQRETNELRSKCSVVPAHVFMFFIIVANLSIASLNISLMLNNVSVYQIAKLCVLPYTGIAEYWSMGRTIPLNCVLCIVLVLVGVGLTSVSDVTLTWYGCFWATLSIFASGTQQVMVSWIQHKYHVRSSDLLEQVALAQAFTLLLFGPTLDYAITMTWVHEYVFTKTSLCLLVSSCMIAILVNYSQFLCLGRFSALSFQVLAHVKTILIFGMGIIIFEETLSLKLACGITTAMFGIVGYGVARKAGTKQ